MTPAFQHNIGAFAAAVLAVAPQLAPSGSINGVAIDRFAHSHALSCILHQAVGAETGAPTAATVQTKLQHSPDGVNWADYIPPGQSAVAQTIALTVANTDDSLAVDLSSANRFVRAVMAVTLTAGTSPDIYVSADLVLGGENRLPAT